MGSGANERTGATIERQRAMSDSLGFLNHGPLPFVGRSRELERLLAFWRGTPEAQELRAALVLGEAGIGKSRLLEEFLTRASRDGGVLVHAKLYPESTGSVISLLATALRGIDASGNAQRKPADDSTSAVVASLRRSSRLRPTLVIVEDAHLLAGASLAEFSLLLSALADEFISLLCLARPVNLEFKAILEQYLVDEIELKGLTDIDVQRLWEEVHGDANNNEVAPLLQHVSGGNPLALRSALRSAIKSGALQRDDRTGVLRIGVQPGLLDGMVKGSVELLSEGMATHLSGEERAAASRLSMLGEIFSREAARVMINESESTIAGLIAKGIIAPSTAAAAPLPAISSQRTRSFPITSHRLLSFTHSLLHRHLLSHARDGGPRIVAAIAEGCPLYSVLPLHLLGDLDHRERSAPATVREAMLRMFAVAFHLDSTSDWQQTEGILRGARRLFEMHCDDWDQQQQADLRALLLYHTVLIHRRENATPAFRDMVDELLRQTSAPTSPTLQEMHLRGLRYRHWLAANRGDYAECEAVWDEAEELVSRYRDLRLGRAYADYLRAAVSAAHRFDDFRIARRVEQRLAEIMSSPEADDVHRRDTWALVSTYLLEVFSDEEELAKRLTLLQELERHDDGSDARLRMCKLLMLNSIGQVDEVAASLRSSLPLFAERGETGYVAESLAMQVSGLGLTESDSDTVDARASACLSDIASDLRELYQNDLLHKQMVAALMRGDSQWALRLVQRHPSLLEEMSDDERILYAALPCGEEMPVAVRSAMEFFSTLTESAEEAGDAEGEKTSTIDTARRIIGKPILRLSDALRLRAVIALLESSMRDSEPDGIHDLRKDVHDALGRLLEWLAERRLPLLMKGVLDMHAAYVPPKERNIWQKRLDVLAEERSALGARAPRGDGRLRLSMLGTIAVQEPDAEIQRLRGARIRSFLGLLVADRMLRTPLSYREFSRLAADGDNDPTRARDMVNLSVHRIREALGRDAILTGEETPRLNEARVRVDLLDVHSLLLRVTEARRERALMRAIPAIREALHIVGREVPFPSLYTDFFEAARTDFECALRDAIIGLVDELLGEGEVESAADILQRSVNAMPDDEDLADRLRRALLVLGRRAEAVRSGLAGDDSAQ